MKAVLDIGKTNVKLHFLDNDLKKIISFTRKNSSLAGDLYPHADVLGIWSWLSEIFGSYARITEVSNLIVTTHGATAALIHVDLPDDGLVLPILDYEYADIASCNQAYEDVRPPFGETLSPDLPAGLNLGRQLFWLQQHCGDGFERASHLLMYPQYWGWRLTGQLAGEVTSLGCHTDLWAPAQYNYSSLISHCKWARLLPPLKSAWQELGSVSAKVAAQTGLPVTCKVYVGLHDSNASYLRYLLANNEKTASFAVISTGTWSIIMQHGGGTDVLHERKDMLANCDIFGEPVNCARFMGGREYELICQRLGGDMLETVDHQSIQTAIDNEWMVTPDFSDGNGPFGGAVPVINCPELPSSPAAIATLYYALMIDQRLTDLQSQGPIYIEGSVLKNPLLCSLVAELRPQQPVFLSSDDTGTVQGAAMLTDIARNWGQRLDEFSCLPVGFNGLNEYRARWLTLISDHPLR